MAAGGGKPLCGVDIVFGVDFLAVRGGNLFVPEMVIYEEPVEVIVGVKRAVDGGVSGV